MNLIQGGRGEVIPDDLDLLRRAQGGDDSAFEALVIRHGKDLHGLAFFLTGHASDAEDVVQEALLGAYERIHAFEARSSVKTWLSQIVVRQAARHYRSKKVRQIVQPLKLSEKSQAFLQGKSAVASSDIRLDVLEVLQVLAPDHREIIVLREMEGLSYQEIAEVLDIPAGTVESRLFRARQELKANLKDYLA